MDAFGFLTAGKIQFGRGACAGAASVVAGFGQRVFLVRGGSVSWVDTLKDDLLRAGCAVTEFTCRTEPTVDMVEQARRAAIENTCDVVVSVGGGAVIDLGKAVAALVASDSALMDHLEGVGAGKALSSEPLPFVAIPTTSGTGAEVTKNAVISVPQAGRKVSLRDDRMLPNLAIVDPVLTDNSPRAVTLSAGLDAVTQVIEPYLCNKTNPITDALCRAAIPMGLGALNVLATREDPTARDELSFCSLAGGLALANAGLGAVHGLAGVVGGRLGAPHGLICGRLLGPVLAANRQQSIHMDLDLGRLDDVDRWVSQGLGLPFEMVAQRLPYLLDDWHVPRLSSWVTGDVDLDAIATESAASSSMKANSCTLSIDALVAALRLAL